MLKRKRRSSRSKSKSRNWTAATSVLAFLVFAPPAMAQEKDDAAGSDICIADAICRAHYSRARKLSKKDDYEGALEAYEAAYRRKPAQWLLINMGRTLHKLGRTQDAMDQYRRYLASSDANADLRKKAEQFLTEAEADVAARPKKEPAKTQASDPAQALPGNLPPTSTVNSPDRSSTPSDPATDKRDDKAKTLKPIDVEPVAPASYKEPPPSRLGPLFYGGIAVGGALVVGGVITGIIGLSSAKTLQATPYAGALDKTTLPDLQKRVQNLGYATDVMIPLGVATIAVTTIVSLVRKPASEKTATPAAKNSQPPSIPATHSPPPPPAPPSTPAPAASVQPSVTPSVALAPAETVPPAATESQANNLAPSPVPNPTPNPVPNPTPNPTP